MFTTFSFIFRLIYSYLLPNSFLLFYDALWSVTGVLITTMGILPTIKLLWAFRGVIRGLTPLESLNIHGQDTVRLFINIIKPFWSTIMLSRTGALNLIYLIISTTIFMMFRPIFTIIIRGLLSLIFSSLSIFWIEFLRSFNFLLKYAFYVKDLLSSYITIPIPDVLKITKFQIIGFSIISFISGIYTLTYFNYLYHWNNDLLNYLLFHLPYMYQVSYVLTYLILPFYKLYSFVNYYIPFNPIFRPIYSFIIRCYRYFRPRARPNGSSFLG